MEKSWFKPGHIVRWGKEIGTIVATEEKECLYFKPVNGEARRINYSYEVQRIDLSDKQFENMGFEIVESKIKTEYSILAIYTVLKLNIGRISDFEKYDPTFPTIGEGVISYEDGTEVKYLFHSRSGRKFSRLIPIKTIDELQDALEPYKLELDFNSALLLLIEESMNN